MSQLRQLIVLGTISVIILFITSFLWMGLSPLPPHFIYGTFAALAFFAVIFLVLNVGLLFFKSGRRNTHLMMAAIILVGFCCIPLLGRLIGDRQRSWFFEDGLKLYVPIVTKIMKQKSMLTSTNSSLELIVGRPDIYGKTNADGSVTVLFVRGNNSRRCWMYYSGNQMITYQDDSNIFCFPDNHLRFYSYLTNGWYESIP